MRVKLVLSLTLVMIMAAAAPARAGIFDIIWEMSGPRLFGFGPQCEFGRSSHRRRCFFPVPRDKNFHLPKRTWLIVEPALYFATGKGEWEAGSVMMLAVDPMIAVPWKENNESPHHF